MLDLRGSFSAEAVVEIISSLGKAQPTADINKFLVMATLGLEAPFTTSDLSTIFSTNQLITNH